MVGRGRQGGGRGLGPGPACGIWDSYLFPGKAIYCQASKDSQASTQAFHRHAPKTRILAPNCFLIHAIKSAHSQEFPHTCTQEFPHTCIL
mgnify:CR=1 FL=1